MNDVEPERTAHFWTSVLSPEMLAYFGTIERYADHLRAMNEAAIRDEHVRRYLLEEKVFSACEVPRQPECRRACPPGPRSDAPARRPGILRVVRGGQCGL
jgi:hypothetical protein